MGERKQSGEGDDSLAGGKSSSSTLIIPSVCVDIQAAKRKVESGWRLGRQIHRVPQQLRPKKDVYDPVMVSIGPYHHGEPRLSQFEEFKRETLAIFLSDSGRDKEFFYSKILVEINEIRSCYVGVTTDKYDDATLSEMMLHDACFLIYYMKVNTGDMNFTKHVLSNLGMFTGVLTGTDLVMMENQIPYRIIKLLICLRFGEVEGKALIRKHLSDLCFGYGNRLTIVPWEEGEGEEPLHLLEATQRIIVRMEHCSNITKGIADYKYLSRQFHSVTYLKTKGIHFGPSSSCLEDVRFKSHTFHGKLLLPVRFVNTEDKVFFPNLIAFELSPGLRTDFSVTSYINLMKRLIKSTQDVKELREHGILFSNLTSNEEVVNLFQEIDTMGGVRIDYFDDVKMRIQEHIEESSRNKSKKWIVELINAYFRSPWTAIALLAATFLLVLTFLQTYYTIRAA